MCKLCDALTDNRKVYVIQRSRMSNDNLEELLKEETNYYLEPNEEESYFTISSIYIEEQKQYYLLYSFYNNYDLGHGKKLLIDRFSETIPLNYCFICGKQLVENGKMFDKNDYRYEIEE